MALGKLFNPRFFIYKTGIRSKNTLRDMMVWYKTSLSVLFIGESISSLSHCCGRQGINEQVNVFAFDGGTTQWDRQKCIHYYMIYKLHTPRVQLKLQEHAEGEECGCSAHGGCDTAGWCIERWW